MAVKFSITLRKTGSSMSVSIPKPVTDGFNWQAGDILTLTVTDDKIIVEKLELTVTDDKIIVKKPKPTKS